MSEGDAGDAREELVVTGTRTRRPRGESPVPVEVVTREDLLASGAEDLAEALDGVAGLDVQWSYLGASLRMHGLEPEHVLLLVNGARQIGRKDGVLDLSRIPIEDIERIEIIKGAAAAQYGSDAMGGVVNIITRTPSSTDRWGWSGRARYGTYDTVDITGGVRHRGVRLTGGWHQTDGYDLDPSDLTTEGAARRGWEVSGEGRLSLGEGGDAGWLGQYTQRSPSRIDQSASGAVYDISNVTEDFQARLSPAWVPDARSRLSMQGGMALFRDQYLRDQRDSAAEDQYEDTRQQQGDVSAQYDRLLGEAHLLSVGLDGLMEDLESPRLSAVGSRARLGVFAQDEWRLGAWSLLPGARWDGDTQFGGQFSPRLAVRWGMAEGWVLRAGYGHGYRAPSFRELLLRFDNPSVGYVVVGSLDLQPEHSRGVTLDVDAEVSSWLTVRGGLFWDRVDDLITIELAEESVGLDEYRYTNIAAARSRGAESAATLALGPARLTGSYTLTDTLDLELGLPLSGRARHRGTVGLRLPIEPLGLSVQSRASLVGPQIYTNDEDGTVSESPAHTSLDARATVRLHPTTALVAGGNNVLNAGAGVFLPPPPRMLYLGLTVQPPRTPPSPVEDME